MRKWAYYNDTDEYCAEWIKRLIGAGLLPDGDIDTRPIQQVQPEEVKGYGQVHLFAGFGGWPYALRCAGWPDERPIWTGSCPCQPFSIAGKGAGEADPRHLWPDFFRLASACRPAVCMGEQVAGAAGYAWFDGVAASLESEGYGCRAVDIPAAAVNAPHIRQRLYWVADTSGARLSFPEQRGVTSEAERQLETRPAATELRSGPDAPGGLGDPDCPQWREDAQGWGYVNDRADAGRQKASSRPELAGAWDDWVLVGPDPNGKYRRVKPGLPLLVARLPGDVPKLRAIGNALVHPLAVEVIKAYMETA